MAETYPASLPLPESVSYGISNTFGLARTNIPNPIKNQEKYYNSPRVQITATWAMDDATYDTWLTWIKDNGYVWFYMQVISTHQPVLITSSQLVRVISPVQMSLQGFNWQRVSLSMELVPGAANDPLAPTPVYSEFVDAGSPGAPSVDIIDAGTPAVQPADLITASLYSYGY